MAYQPLPDYTSKYFTGWNPDNPTIRQYTPNPEYISPTIFENNSTTDRSKMGIVIKPNPVFTQMQQVQNAILKNRKSNSIDFNKPKGLPTNANSFSALADTSNLPGSVLENKKIILPAEPKKSFAPQVNTNPIDTTAQEPVQTNPMEAFQGRLLDRNKKMDDALIQGMQNEQGIQGMNAANSAAAYNNMLQGSIARSANMQRHGSYTPTYQQAQTYTPQAFNFGSQEPKENPYAQFFNKGSMQITPSKNGMKPAEIPQNAITVGGKSIWDSSGKMIDPEMKASTQRFFTPNQPVQETSQDRINKMYVLGKSRNQGSYDPSQMRWSN